MTALNISAGPAHFSDRRTSSGQYILSFTGPYRPSRYMAGHQISNSAGPNDDKSQSMYFSRGRPPHISAVFAQSFCNLLQRDASVARVGVGHVNQTDFLDHTARDTSMRTSGTHPGTFSAKHKAWFRVNSFAFGWWFNQMRGDFWSVNLKY